MTKWKVQLSRYVVVGLASNGIGYCLYLLLTELGIGHKTAMTLLYAVGVLQSFHFNRVWSFSHVARAGPAFLRYVSAYLLGYGLNLGVLLLLVDRWGWPHQWVQGMMIVVLAAMLFLAQRHWVFRQCRANPPWT
jgi:putative flippase GtrA